MLKYGKAPQAQVRKFLAATQSVLMQRDSYSQTSQEINIQNIRLGQAFEARLYELIKSSGFGPAENKLVLS